MTSMRNWATKHSKIGRLQKEEQLHPCPICMLSYYFSKESLVSLSGLNILRCLVAGKKQEKHCKFGLCSWYFLHSCTNSFRDSTRCAPSPPFSLFRGGCVLVKKQIIVVVSEYWVGLFQSNVDSKLPNKVPNVKLNTQK